MVTAETPAEPEQLDVLLERLRGLDGVLELAPRASPFPEVAWGDHFFYYAPDGEVPQTDQPFVTVVTKDYPDEPSSGLDPAGRWRVNIHVGRDGYVELLGQEPREEVGEVAWTRADTVLPHPVYRAQGWVAVVNPGPQTAETVTELALRAHQDAQARWERRRSNQS